MYTILLFLLLISFIGLVIVLINPHINRLYISDGIMRRELVAVLALMLSMFLVLLFLSEITKEKELQFFYDETPVELYSSYLKQANMAFERGDKETAKGLYKQAALEGSVDAHFALGYRYTLPIEEQLFHFIEAAKKGHEDALAYALEPLFFRAGQNFKDSDPMRALEVYQEAKIANPQIDIYGVEGELKAMQMCVEAGEFDVQTFMDTYNINSDEVNGWDFYGVWTLAEEASKGGRFGVPNTLLTLQLVCRGGEVPFELMSAVEDVHTNWKEGTKNEFTFCNYVTSGIGQSVCTSREYDLAETERTKRLENIRESLDDVSKGLLLPAYESAKKYFEIKALHEEGYYGSSYGSMVTVSVGSQSEKYIQLIVEIKNGYAPTSIQSLAEAEQRLEETYKMVLMELDKVHAKYEFVDYQPISDEVTETQIAWQTYRDLSAKLFARLNPAVSEDVYKSWLSETRERDLLGVLESGM